MSEPLVSVVMPSLNQAQFLEEAVRSVLEQSYDHVELIVVDGMSTDGSIDLLVTLQKEFGDKLQWVCQKDTGPAQALNHAMTLTQGDIVGWLNSDDEYAPEAIERAVEYLQRMPNHQMVYGFGHHINAAGELLDTYPTKPPSTPIDAFANGSFICQPTVFMRKKALEQVGPLDETIKTAFDFDLWLRFFKRFPRQIGHIRRMQAYSRLHASCMTRRLRKQVAIDGLMVVAKHLGTAPDHWIWTHIDEMCEHYPFVDDALPLNKQLEAFLKEIRPLVAADKFRDLIEKLKKDYRFGLAGPQLFASVQPDGWVSKHLTVKYRWEGKPASAILVSCNANWPVPGKMHLKVSTPTGHVQKSSVEVPSEFVLSFDVPETDRSGYIMWTIETSQSFVPSKHDKKSTDNRKLSFTVTGLKVRP
jgi:glycosyltransferase involved in cell wall biosynthesis